MGCNVDGRHPHDIIDDINSGAVECPAVSDLCIDFLKIRVKTGGEANVFLGKRWKILEVLNSGVGR